MTTADFGKARGTAGPRSFTPANGDSMVPDPIVFFPAFSPARSAVIASNVAIVAGSGGPYEMSVDKGEYRINGGGWTSYTTTGATLAIGDTIQIRTAASSSYATTVTTTLSIAGSAFSAWSLSTPGAPQAVANGSAGDNRTLADALFGSGFFSNMRRR